MAITLKDVASVAGVSTATVSRALAGSERVAPQTAVHIRTIADDLGYRFDNVARALRQKRSNLVGMVAPDYAFPGAHDFLYALNQELFRAEFVFASVPSFGSADHEFVQVERLLGQRMDALLILPSDPVKSAEAINIALDEEIPVIQLHRPLPNPRTAAFTLDYEAGIDFALRYCGYHPDMTVLYCGDASTFAADLKREAFLSVLSRRNMHANQLRRLDAILDQSGFCIAHRLSGAPIPDVLVCDSRRIAEIVLPFYAARLNEAGRPWIVCLDALPRADMRDAGKLIAVEYPMYELASRIVEAINGALNDEALAPENLRLQPFINL